MAIAQYCNCNNCVLIIRNKFVKIIASILYIYIYTLFHNESKQKNQTMEFNGNYIAHYLAIALIGFGVLLLIAERVYAKDRTIVEKKR